MFANLINITALSKHRDQLAEQLKCQSNLTNANHNREIQMEKYKNALEARNTESANILETFKKEVISLRSGTTLFISDGVGQIDQSPRDL